MTPKMQTRKLSGNAPSPMAIRVLVADDDDRLRSLVATLLRQVAGVSLVLEAKDGAQAVQLGRDLRIDVTVVDFNMSHIDGVEAALRLRALQPSMRIALDSSDPESLRARASSLGLPLFDKAEFERLIEWVERQVHRWSSTNGEGSLKVAPLTRRVEMSCSRCGYGIVCRKPPERCPMCRTGATWGEPSQPLSQHAAL
jgi:CheY-like chemotaxis protein